MKRNTLSSKPWIMIYVIFELSTFGIILTEGLLQDQYLGCFYDNSSQSPSTRRLQESRAPVTVEKCIQHCKSGGEFTYAKLQNGTLCQCDNEYGIELPDTLCNLTCAGNQSQYCGGEQYMNLSTYVYYAVCPIGNHSEDCDKVCHCRRHLPCDRKTGNCPNGCEGNYIGNSCNEISLQQQYIGCYQDNNSNRAMSKRLDPGGNSWQLCVSLCAREKSSFAAPQFGGECWCGESYDKHGKLDESKCNSICNLNTKENCGGASALSVLHVCPVGHFGKGCREVCNCYNGSCSFQNGTCETLFCSPGWTGDSCNLRDCQESNGDCLEDESCLNVDVKYAKVSVCRCKEGFRRSKLWENCTDVDECSETPNICGLHALECKNIIGGYSCRCMDGNTFRNGLCRPSMVISNVNSVIGPVLVSIPILVVVLAVILFLYLRRRKTSEKSFRRISSSVAPSQDTPDLDANPYESITYTTSSAVREMSVDHLPDIIRSTLSNAVALEKEFEAVPMETKELCNVGKHRDLKKKNRFKNIIPYDYNRVVLKKMNNISLSDYINASYIKGYGTSDKFIATQGPNTFTIDDFWRMVCEKNVGVIVMITDLVENKKVKCEKYWPEVGSRDLHDDIIVQATKEELYIDYATRHFQVTDRTKTLNVVQCHFLSWPDHGVPKDTHSFLNFHRKIRQFMTSDKLTVVHCSAGAGRSGSFIAIDFLLEQRRFDGNIDIFGCFQYLREQRSQMVQTIEQYRFIHAAILDSLTIGDTSIQNTKFSSQFKELQRVDPEKRVSQFDVQYQSFCETKEKLAGSKYFRVTSKLVDKNRIAEMDPAFAPGWKGKEVYITLKMPAASAIQEFYTLCREYGCKVVIFLDNQQGSNHSIFPTAKADLSFGQYRVRCDSSSNEDYGFRYRLTERKQSDETYANVASFAIYANTESEPDKREMHVFHVTESMTNDTIGYHSLFSLHRHLNTLKSTKSGSSSFVISRDGYSLTGFCLAALNAFDMSRDEGEVDIYQIVQDIRKSRDAFEFSLVSYKTLYEVASQFVDASHRVEKPGETS